MHMIDLFLPLPLVEEREKGKENSIILHIYQSWHKYSLPIVDNMLTPSFLLPIISFNNSYNLPVFHFNCSLSANKNCHNPKTLRNLFKAAADMDIIQWRRRLKTWMRFPMNCSSSPHTCTRNDCIWNHNTLARYPVMFMLYLAAIDFQGLSNTPEWNALTSKNNAF